MSHQTNEIIKFQHLSNNSASNSPPPTRKMWQNSANSLQVLKQQLQSNNGRETGKVYDKVNLRLFNSDTEDDDFSGCSVKEWEECGDE